MSCSHKVGGLPLVISYSFRDYYYQYMITQEKLKNKQHVSAGI